MYAIHCGMAEKVNSLPKANYGRGKYPWDEWLDGDVWRLTAGEDFGALPYAFRVNAYAVARKRGLKVSVQLEDEDGKQYVYMQAHKP